MADNNEWEKHVDEESDSVYYYNGRTGESSWEVPAGFKPLQTSKTSQDCTTTKWREFVDDASGATYYYDEVTGVSRWDKPDDFVPEKSDKEEEQNEPNIQEDKSQDTEQQAEEIAAPIEQESQGEKEKTESEQREKRKCVSSDSDKAESNGKEEGKVEEDDSTAQPWVKYMDAASNKPYYFNASTGKTQWETPKGFSESAQATVHSTGPQVSAEYQAHLNRLRTERLTQATQQVLDPSGNLSKLNAILSGIDDKASSATAPVDGEAATDITRTATVEWQQHIDAQTQRYYYHNVITGVTQWNEPDAPVVSGLASWIPPEIPESDSTGADHKTVSGMSYAVQAKFNRLTGKYEQLGGDEYWQKAGIASDRAGRQMSHFFDMTELEKNREEARRRKEQLKRKNINWKKITAEKKAKKQKQKNEWLFTD